MTVTLTKTTIGELTCRVVDGLAAGVMPQANVVLCHGYGAGGDDLVGIGQEVLRAVPELQQTTRFVFPEAPNDLSDAGMPGGRAWWPLNMAALQRMMNTGDYEDLVAVEPPGLQEASQRIADAVRELQAASAESTRLILGGFSQGAMVTMDALLRHQLNVDHQIIFSGSLLCREDWTAMAARLQAKPPVLQFHGTIDMLLPIKSARWLHQMLESAGFDVNYHEFNGQHTIPMEALLELVKILP